ncbi:MAG: MiaB/RimO family radical SAM methylthiotransferase [Acidobacteria bacterium]|jgi:threonylcarbamoyladenosine tRNA methylthiotransferase MtaB|nr:MiaB/RimO family radical SAM methylthiotransferase [Acidobacteriota bacterium]
MRRYHVVTLGCKLNQFDSAQTEGLLRAAGLVPTADPAEAEVILLNTCTVTAAADRDGRRLARRLRRINPGARIVAAGCYAERDPGTLRGLGVLDAVLGRTARHRLPAALLGRAAAESPGAAPAVFFEESARAWLRVQEGCDLACSYCVIPRVRGPGRSRPAVEALADARTLAARGVREIGLTGVNVGSWGRDLAPRAELADLLDALLAARLPLTLRLNSLEPRTVTARIVERLAETPPARLAPHLQVPLQSGCDRVLGAMARNYRTADYRRVIETLVARVPDICVGADLIAGFPGESEAEHRETLAFVESLPLAYLHVFSFSARPGTRAAALPDRLPPDAVRDRTAALRALGAAKRRAYRERLIGRTLPALALAGLAPDGWRRTLTTHYIEVLVPAAPPGAPLAVRLTGVEADGETVRGAVA